MWEKYKLLIISIISIIILFIGNHVINTYINNKIFEKTLEIKENFALEKAELAKQLEADKINERAICEKEIIDLKTQLEKAKILLDKIQKQKTYSTMVKKDVKSFINEVNTLFDLKGKNNDVKK